MPVRHVDLPYKEIPYLSVLDEHGTLDEALDPQIPEETLRRLYRTMLFVRAFDDQRLRLQRQGRIGTFAPVKGQEAAQLGSIAALRETDWMVPAFRETAVALWRGMPPENDLLYCAGYEEAIDLSADARDLPIAIPVGSQIPHAAGLAWARKLQGHDDVVITYFGDGATSEGDFHEGLNFAAVFGAPCIFFCQNNHYAISVPRKRQTRARTLAQKAIAYEMPALQVDGNDVLAVYRATAEAAERARRGEGPTLIEAVTYRLSVHTTADDPTKYRSLDEVEVWEKRDPIPRFRGYLLKRGILTEDEEAGWLDEVREEVQGAVRRFEEMQGADPLRMFDHIYSELPPFVERQRRELEAYVRASPDPVVETPREREEALRGQRPTPGGTMVPEPDRLGEAGRRGGEE